MQSIRNRLGIALENDHIGDPIKVVTRKANKSEWFLILNIRVRFPSKRLVMSVYDQQLAPVKNKGDNDNRILTHDGHISPTIIPTRHTGSESSEASLHNVFVSYELLRGKDSGELPTLFQDIINDVYKELFLKPG